MTVATLLLLVLAAAPPAAPDPVTAEAAIANHQREFDSKLGLKCSQGAEGDEIVVCGRRPGDPPPGSESRVPYVPEPGRRIPGEGSADGGGCMRLCHQPLKLDLLKVPGAAKKVFDALTGRDD